MSPVVIVGFGALDAALVSQAIYAYRDLRRAGERTHRADRVTQLQRVGEGAAERRP
jgi:hypothetical protein